MADGSGMMQTIFTPDTDNTRLLRMAFGRFATGITVVTALGEDGPVGMTANSFSSLSLDPPLVMWALDMNSRRFPFFEKAQHFAIHVLAAEDRDICDGFAKSSDAFHLAPVKRNAHGVPLLPNCLARFECRQHSMFPGGDHKIIVGAVERAEMRDGDALAFYGGDIRRLPG